MTEHCGMDSVAVLSAAWLAVLRLQNDFHFELNTVDVSGRWSVFGRFELASAERFPGSGTFFLT